MGLTNFPNGISSFGIPVYGSGNIPTTSGNTYFVNYTTGVDAGPGTSINQPWKTIAYAYSQVTTGNDDIICLTGSASHVLSSILTVSKTRVHFIGVDGTNGRLYGQNAKVTITATSGASNIAAVLNLGTRNSFTNIKFISNSTVTEGKYAVADGGEYGLWQNCEFYLSTHLDVTDAADVLMNCDSGQYVGCTFGSLATPVTAGSIIRPSILLTAGLAGSGLVCRDVTVANSLVWKNASNTANALVYAANATDVERQFLFKGCGFINNKAAAALPAQAIKTGATLTVGQIILDPTCYASNVTKVSTSTGVIVTGPAPNSGAGIGTNAA